jgi:hypothetical protein
MITSWLLTVTLWGTGVFTVPSHDCERERDCAYKTYQVCLEAAEAQRQGYINDGRAVSEYTVTCLPKD